MFVFVFVFVFGFVFGFGQAAKTAPTSRMPMASPAGEVGKKGEIMNCTAYCTRKMQ